MSESLNTAPLHMIQKRYTQFKKYFSDNKKFAERMNQDYGLKFGEDDYLQNGLCFDEYKDFLDTKFSNQDLQKYGIKIKDDKKIVFAWGRCSIAKGFKELALAWGKAHNFLPNHYLILQMPNNSGEADYFIAVKKILKDIPRVIILDDFNPNIWKTVLRSVNTEIVCIPSLMDPVPHTSIEAKLFSKEMNYITLISDVDGALDAFKENECMYVDPRDMEIFANKIIEAANLDNSRRREIIDCCEEFCMERISIDKVFNEIKLAFINGLKDVVLNEISQYPNLHVIEKEGDFIYLEFIQDFSQLKCLKSVLRVYVIMHNPKYNPLYISKHKSIVGNLIAMITDDKKEQFKTFKIICAGSDSAEVRSIVEYIQETYKLTEEENADIKIHITKTNDIWEVGIQITSRPLSVRGYKIKNMEGAMDSTIAYAVNSLCELEKVDSYLNIFSGSATLLIEAAQCYPNLKQLVGFDNNKQNLSLSMQNIRKAGLIKKIRIKEEDIFDEPSLGKFDVITSDLPFGMLVSKHEDLENLYRYFIGYCEKSLNAQGILAVYTNKHEMLKNNILESEFRIIKKLKLKLITSTNMYLYPQIFVCKLKENRIK